MDPSEAGGAEKEKEREKEKVIKRRNRPVFLRYLERRKTDTIVAEDMVKGDINLGTLVRRSQSDKTEYSAKLKGTQKTALPQGKKKLWQQSTYTHDPTLCQLIDTGWGNLWTRISMVNVLWAAAFMA